MPQTPIIRGYLIFDDVSDSDLKGLYEQCDTLVAPSRAEGFGLPLAEAMLSGLHVITTGWSGQLDFCTSDNADFIDYTFAPAATHEGGKPSSVWAEPDVNHLALLLRQRLEAKETPVARGAITSNLLETFNWREVARQKFRPLSELAISRALWIRTSVGYQHLASGVESPLTPNISSMSLGSQ